MIKYRAASLLAILLILIQPAYAQSEEKAWDDTHIEQANEFLDHLNSNDPIKIEAYYRRTFGELMLKNFSMDHHLRIARKNFQDLGELNFHSILGLHSLQWHEELGVLVRSKRTEQWMKLTLWLDKTEKRKILGLIILPANAEDIPPATKQLSTRSIKKRLSTYLQRMEKEDVFSGAVLLAKGNEVVFSKAYGYASKRYDVKNTGKTKFNLGSINKIFTSVAIMQLVETGKLFLDDPLDQYVSEEWLPKEQSKKLTIRHLITHSSGLGDFFNEDFENTPMFKVDGMLGLQPFVVTDTIRFEPGSKFMYSNNGMQLLGVVIEQASGQSYYDYVDEHIFTPTGMQSAGSYNTDSPEKNVATGYYKNQEGLWRNNFLLLPAKGSAAGGGYSTVDNLYLFARALLDNKYVNHSSQELLFTIPETIENSNYGHGFEVYENPKTKEKRVGHSGGYPGVSANMDIYLDQGYIAIVLSNYSTGSIPVVSKIRELLAQEKD